MFSDSITLVSSLFFFFLGFWFALVSYQPFFWVGGGCFKESHPLFPEKSGSFPRCFTPSFLSPPIFLWVGYDWKGGVATPISPFFSPPEQTSLTLICYGWLASWNRGVICSVKTTKKTLTLRCVCAICAVLCCAVLFCDNNLFSLSFLMCYSGATLKNGERLPPLFWCAVCSSLF